MNGAGPDRQHAAPSLASLQYSGLRGYKRNPGRQQIIEEAVRSELWRYYIIDGVQGFSCFSATQQFSAIWTEYQFQVD